jgi:polyisoprenoid-binding protein YceI
MMPNWKEHLVASHIARRPDGSAELPLPDGVWYVDRSRSEIGFAVKTLGGLATVRGKFAEYGGTMKTEQGHASGELTIGAESVDTGNRKRDQHLRSPDFFDAARYPRIIFTATGFAATDGGETIAGRLAVGSTELRLEVPVTVRRISDDVVSLEGKTAVSRQAVGITWNKLGMVKDPVSVRAQLTLWRESS